MTEPPVRSGWCKSEATRRRVAPGLRATRASSPTPRGDRCALARPAHIWSYWSHAKDLARRRQGPPVGARRRCRVSAAQDADPAAWETLGGHRAGRRGHARATSVTAALRTRHPLSLRCTRGRRPAGSRGRSARRSPVKLVLDASVAVAAARPGEPSHRAARDRVEAVLSGRDEIVVPVLFSVEVAASLARVGVALPAIRAYVKELLGAATVVPLGPRVARQARETAMRWKLRAADAMYVWVAEREGVPLCTLDDELERRAGGACTIVSP